RASAVFARSATMSLMRVVISPWYCASNDTPISAVSPTTTVVALSISLRRATSVLTASATVMASSSVISEAMPAADGLDGAPVDIMDDAVCSGAIVGATVGASVGAWVAGAAVVIIGEGDACGVVSLAQPARPSASSA